MALQKLMQISLKYILLQNEYQIVQKKEIKGKSSK